MFTLVYRKNVNSIKKMIFVYFQLLGVGVARKEIDVLTFNKIKKRRKIVIKCFSSGDEVGIHYGEEIKFINYKDAVYFLFTESGYDGNYIINPKIQKKI